MQSRKCKSLDSVQIQISPEKKNFRGRAQFKGTQHVTAKSTKVTVGTKIFVKPRAIFRDKFSMLEQISWGLTANLVKNSKKIHELANFQTPHFFKQDRPRRSVFTSICKNARRID